VIQQTKEKWNQDTEDIDKLWTQTINHREISDPEDQGSSNGKSKFRRNYHILYWGWNSEFHFNMILFNWNSFSAIYRFPSIE
jgi:hypothetical protein